MDLVPPIAIEAQVAPSERAAAKLLRLVELGATQILYPVLHRGMSGLLGRPSTQTG